MQVIIPVAGKGTRLRPHTHTTAKPLLHVAGKTVLQHILDKLEGLDISEIIFITGHLGDQFENLKTKHKVTTIRQDKQIGTAHAIRLARERINEPVLIVFADTVFEADMSVMDGLKADGIIWAKEVEDYQRFGVIVHKNNVMERIVEKPSEPVSRLANIGVYYIKDYKALFEGIDYVFEKDLQKKGEYFLTDAFQWMVDNGRKLIVEPVDGWYDCGTWECLVDTNRALLGKHKYRSPKSKTKDSVIIEPVWLEDDVEIEGSIVGPFVSVAKGARIRGSIVRDSIINTKAALNHVLLTDSIIGDEAEINGNRRKVSVGSHSNLDF
jgi:glucose-1-phosphate thymidylyltransferase